MTQARKKSVVDSLLREDSEPLMARTAKEKVVAVEAKVEPHSTVTTDLPVTTKKAMAKAEENAVAEAEEAAVEPAVACKRRT